MHPEPTMTNIHPLDPEDAVITAALRAMLSSSKGARPGAEARGQYDALMESVLPRDDVTFEADILGGVRGLWVQPADWRSRDRKSTRLNSSHSSISYAVFCLKKKKQKKLKHRNGSFT